MILALSNMIPISSSPEMFKEILLKYNKVIIRVDNLKNDYTHSCKPDELIVVEQGRPIISASKRYIIGIGNRLLYCKAMQKRNKSVIYLLGIGETKISDIKILCNAKKMK